MIRPSGSDEHLPGSAALNDTPVTVNYLRSEGGDMKSVRKFERDGFVVRTICAHCNKKTGGMYGEAFKEFARQFAASGNLFTPNQKRAWISLKSILPSRVLKQLGGMVLAAQPNLVAPENWKSLQKFVLSRDKPITSDVGKFYLYRNVSGIGRISSLGALGMIGVRSKVPTLIFSEISWPPMGLIYALEPNPLLNDMTDITDWGLAGFRERRSYEFTVPQFRVEANWPLAFGTKKEADEWINRNHVVMLLWGDTSGDDPTQVSTTVHRHTR